MNYLKSLPIWVAWKFEEVKVPGSDASKAPRKTKIPYQINGQKASSIDPTHWSTFENITKHSHNFDGIGFVISSQYPLLCIDLDHVLDNGTFKREDHEILVNISDTYTELSPSKEGLHIILKLSEFFPLLKNRKTNDDGTGVEAYTENRYFTFTENSFGEQKEIRTVGKEEAEEILRIVGYPWGAKKESIEVVKSEAAAYDFPSKTLLTKMFKAKGGAKLQRLYNGDISDYNDDHSTADAAFLTSLAFWTAKNPSQMEEIWLASPLGQREKTQTRKDYRDRTINAVLPMVTSVYEKQKIDLSVINPNSVIKPVFLGELKLDCHNNKDGRPHNNIPNVVEILKTDSYLANAFRFNQFSELNETNIDNGADWVPLQPNHETSITEYIQKVYNHFQNISEATVRAAILVYSRTKVVNPPLEMIKNTVWDQVPRIEGWLSLVFNIEATPLIKAISANWIKGLVNRVIEPGCQFDTVLVLEGAQGIGKSSVMRALTEPWYAETILNADQKDFQLVLMQNIVVEFSEGATLSRSDSKTLKNIITTREDNMRRPYDKAPGKYKRHCVFAMTTNEEQYLKDETGNRRWLPVALGSHKANVEWVKENRAQMFAEAYHRLYTLHETNYEFPDGLEQEQEARLEDDPWVLAILEWYFDELTDIQRNEGVTTLQAYNKALWSLTKKDFTAGQSQRVAAIYRNYIALNKKQIQENGVKNRKYFPTEKTDLINKIRTENLTTEEIAAKAEKAAQTNHGMVSSYTGNKF